VNTTVAIGASEINPYIGSQPSCLGEDGAELRLYAFDGRHLTLAATQDTNLRAEGVAFTPDGEFLLSIERVSPVNTVGQVASAISTGLLATSKVPLRELREHFARHRPHPSHDLGTTCFTSLFPTRQQCLPNSGVLCADPCTLTTANLPFERAIDFGKAMPVACLRLIRIKGGVPFSAYNLSFSMNSEWFVVAGGTVGTFAASETNPPATCFAPDVFPIQLFRVFSALC